MHLAECVSKQSVHNHVFVLSKRNTFMKVRICFDFFAFSFVLNLCFTELFLVLIPKIDIFFILKFAHF